MKKIITKEALKKSLAKSIADKKLVRAYMRGEVTKQFINDKGIKFANPL